MDFRHTSLGGVTPTLQAKSTGGHSLNYLPGVMAFTQNQREEVRILGDRTGALAADAGAHQQNYIAMPGGLQALYYSHDFNQDRIYSADGIVPAHTASDSNQAHNIFYGGPVRRLTPTECARLQGFPDDWNAWLSDSARYRQFGNAVTVNVAEWIGRRIVEAVS